MLRRTIGISATAAAITLAAIAPASAGLPPSGLDAYNASASATALEVTLLGQSFAVSQTQAEVNSSPRAAADGAALLLAGSAAPGRAPSSSPGGQPTNSQCPIQADLDALTQGALSGLQLEVACLTTSASTDGSPSAESGAGEVTIRILGPGGALVDPVLGPVLAGATQVTDPIVEALAPVLGAINDVSEIDVPAVLDELTTAIGDQTFVLAEIVVAPSLSRASADNTDGVVANAGSNGVTINILPGIASTLAELTGLVDLPNPSSAPLLQVKLGAANAKVVRDPLEGLPTPTATAAQLLSITADDELGIIQDITGQLAAGVNALPLAQLNCETGVLADIVCIDLGTVNELDSAELAARNLNFGAGTVGIEATAANVQVLPVAADALGGSVLGLTLARSTAASGSTVPLPGDGGECVPPNPLCLPLARTGGDSMLPVTLALLALGSVGAALLRRSRTI